MKLFVVFLASIVAAGCSAPGSNSVHSGHASPGAGNASPAVDHSAMGHGPAAEHSGMKGSPGAASAAMELQFLDTMIAHHRGAVEMSVQAESLAQRAEVKELAANIIDAQEREIAKMSEWRERWFEGKPEAVNLEFPGMTEGMAGMDMKKLGSLTGDQFDVEFVRQMIPHHEGALKMAKAIQAQDARPEVKELAKDVIKSQETEIKQMKEWLAAWSK